jgi:hypothetical protein
MNPTLIGAVRPTAVPCVVTSKHTSGPDARSARTGVTINLPGRVCATHEYGMRPSWADAVAMTRSKVAGPATAIVPSPNTHRTCGYPASVSQPRPSS